MTTKVFLVPGPWAGTLFLSARPRGNDWLSDETNAWLNHSIGAVISLLTSEEERDLGLEAEARLVRSLGMEFISFPIEDRTIPGSEGAFGGLLDRAQASLDAGRGILVHCRQGVGRTGLVAAGLLIRAGMSSEAALDLLSDVRGVAVPETSEQKAYVSHLSVAA